VATYHHDERDTMLKSIATAAITATLGLLLAPTAHATDSMYRVGQEILPGDYRYVVTGGDWGAWRTCTTPTCEPLEGMIETSGVIDGLGSTGYMTIPKAASYVKVHNLQLTRMG
jgi:hypothetical protein